MDQNPNNNLYKPCSLPLLDNDHKSLLEQFNVQSKQVYPCCICYFVDSKVIATILSVDYEFVFINLSWGRHQISLRNTLDKLAQIEYLFSINSNAAFTKLEVVIGDKTMYGFIKEKELAKQEYNQGIKDGKTMVYSEKDHEFPDVMRVKLGNLEPGQKLEVHYNIYNNQGSVSMTFGDSKLILLLVLGIDLLRVIIFGSWF